ncbi:MAG: sugar-binding protein [Polyangiaceae bacterium]
MGDFAPALTIAAACALGVVACGLDFDRYATGADAAGDAPAADAGDAATEAAPPDATNGDGPATDAQADASPDAPDDGAPSACHSSPGVLVAAQAPGAITIDGDLGDWGSPTSTILEASSAALISGPNGDCNAANATPKCLVPAGEAAEVSLLRDATNLYVGVRVTVAGVGGTSTTDPYLDDAVEIYVSGDAVATGNYTGVDHQYVVTWQNFILDYGPSQAGPGQPNPPGVTTAVKVAAGNAGYVVEMKIALSQLGQSALSSGRTLGFDVGLDHGQGTSATRSFLVWWMATHAAPTCTTPKCTGCNPDQPYCDTLLFGALCAG